MKWLNLELVFIYIAINMYKYTLLCSLISARELEMRLDKHEFSNTIKLLGEVDSLMTSFIDLASVALSFSSASPYALVQTGLTSIMDIVEDDFANSVA